MESATSIELFVEILDRYVYYFDQRNESVSSPPAIPHRTILTLAGNDQVSQWSYRTYPLEPGREPAGLSLH
jgi:hypothetical protein